jgi:hypothetical protein
MMSLERTDFRFGSKSVIRRCLLNVRIALESGSRSSLLRCRKSAMSGLMHRSKQRPYSITSSAMASAVGGTSKPSALPVLRLMTYLNFVG